MVSNVVLQKSMSKVPKQITKVPKQIHMSDMRDILYYCSIEIGIKIVIIKKFRHIRYTLIHQFSLQKVSLKLTQTSFIYYMTRSKRGEEYMKYRKNSKETKRNLKGILKKPHSKLLLNSKLSFLVLLTSFLTILTSN